MAPELEPMRHGSHEDNDSSSVEYSFRVDCYSFGIVLFEIVTCRHPWQQLRFSSQIIDRVVEGERPEILESEEEACQNAGCGWMLDLMKVCWAQDPRRRPPFSEIFRKIDQRWKLLSAEETAFSVNETFATESRGSNRSDIELSIRSNSSCADSIQSELGLIL